MSLSIPNPINAASPHRSAIVKASAGVGKTYLLVTRLIRLLLLDVKPDAILAITFTRKAAAEMQSRLYERLYSLATASESALSKELDNIGVDNTPAIHSKARGLYEHMMRNERQIKTCTFHAFCQDILRKFPLESDVPPGFELLDDEPSYIAAAWDALYEEVTLAPESPVAQALEQLYDHVNGLANTQSALGSFINQRSDWWAYTAGEEDPVQYATDKLLQELNIDLDASPYLDFFTADTKEDIVSISTLLSKHDTKTNLGYVDKLQMLTNSIAFDGILSEKDLEFWMDLLFSVLYKTNGDIRFDKPVNARAKKMSPEGEDKFLELCTSLCRKINTAKETAKKQHNYYLNAAWYVAGEALLKHFQQIKLQQRLLDFTDLEWRTFALLNHSENANWVQYKLDQRIEHLLVDEFQDTNPTQWRLLLPLMQEFVTDTDRLRSVFLVGDEKQSIYSFRRADPKLFTTASEWLQSHLQAEAFPMDKSRRSASPIMHLLNSIFQSDQFKNTLPGFHPHSTFLESTAGAVEMLPLVEPAENNDEAIIFRNSIITPLPQEDDCYYREGQQIAEKIQYLLNEETIEHNGKRQNISYKDIMILIRSRKHLSSYETALREADIPYISNNKGTLFECQEIQDLIALLEVLYTPYNNLSLATVLRSPIFNCSNEDLSHLSVITKSVESHCWFDVLVDENHQSHWSSALQHAAKCLKQWHQNIGILPIHDLLDSIYHQADIFSQYHTSVPSHFRNRVKSNLTQFLSLALDIDSGRYPSLGRFIAKLHSLMQNDASPDEVAEGNDDGAVKILTIHASKGLEAPVVFLADAADKNREKSKSYSTLVDWPEEERKPTHFLLCPRKDKQVNLVSQLLQEQARKELVENANLLYVALTRARQFLFISGCGKGEINKLGWYGTIHQHWPADNLTQKLPETTAITNDNNAPLSNTENVTSFNFFSYQESQDQETSENKTDDIEDDKAQQRGTVIHRAIELLSKNTTDEQSAIKEQLCAEFRLDISSDYFLLLFNEACNTVNHQAFSSWFDNTKFDQAYNEMSVQVKYRNGLKHGIIDRLVVNDNTVTIIDYKTHPVKNKKELHVIADAYQSQMQLYINAVKKLWPGANVKTIILFTHPLYCVELFKA